MDKKQKMGEDGAIAGICGGYIRTEWQLIRSYCGPRLLRCLSTLKNLQKRRKEMEIERLKSEEWSEIDGCTNDLFNIVDPLD